MRKNQTLTTSPLSVKTLTMARLGILLGTALLLLMPLVAMQFTDSVKWSPFDFVVAGILLFSTGLTFELAVRKIKTTKHRKIAGVVLLMVLFVVWVELAVGIFGTPFAGN